MPYTVADTVADDEALIQNPDREGGRIQALILR